MSIGLVDLFIILFIILGGIVGFKHGAIKEGTQFIGLFVVIIISFILKDKLMVMLYENLPFFDFFGFIKGVSAINVLFYQLISFLVIFTALMFILKVLIVITGFVELLLKMTIFLSFPSKILGILVGALEYYVYLFIAIYVLSMPIFNLTFVSDSMLGNTMLENTPILSGLVDNTVKVYGDVWNSIKNKEDKTNQEINKEVLTTLLDNKLITVESAEKLIQTNKIVIEDNNFLENYKNNNK